MIEVPVHNSKGEQVDTLQVDEQLLGGAVRLTLLKQAYVRSHANRRQGSASTKSRGETSYSTAKMYRQKGTGNARRGDRGTNILRGGGMAFAKKPRSFRQNMPVKMRRLANRNAILAKVVDQEVKLVDSFGFDKPNTKGFASLLAALNIDRTCLVAVNDTASVEARSAKNADHVSVTLADRLNVFDVLNHRYLLADKATFVAHLERAAKLSGGMRHELVDAGAEAVGSQEAE